MNKCVFTRVPKLLFFVITCTILSSCLAMDQEPNQQNPEQQKQATKELGEQKKFDQWKQLCDKLPKYGDVSAREKYKHTPLTRKEFEQTIKQLIVTMQKSPFANSDNWVYADAPEQEYFECNDEKNRDDFFVQKLVADENIQVSIHADIHADIHSTVAYINNLVKKGWIDNNFVITNPHAYLVFLGDYSDRGNYGSEVLYTIARLKIANPKQVILLRGNHEDVRLNDQYGLIRTIRRKEFIPPRTYLSYLGDYTEQGYYSQQAFLTSKQAKNAYYYKDGELLAKFGFTHKEAKKLLNTMYRMMPAALYIGRAAKNSNSSTDDYALLCHGGIEPRFNPHPLLADKRNDVFQWIGVLNIAWLSQELQKLLIQDAGIFESGRLPFGFTWNDFLLDKKATAKDTRTRGLAFGMEISKKLLKECGSAPDNYRVKCMFRGHQHSGEMLQKMLENNGLYNLWADVQFSKNWPATNLAHTLPVWILNVSPCSLYGSRKGYNYDTSVILHLNGQYEQWNLELENTIVFPPKKKIEDENTQKEKQNQENIKKEEKKKTQVLKSAVKISGAVAGLMLAKKAWKTYKNNNNNNDNNNNNNNDGSGGQNPKRTNNYTTRRYHTYGKPAWKPNLQHMHYTQPMINIFDIKNYKNNFEQYSLEQEIQSSCTMNYQPPILPVSNLENMGVMSKALSKILPYFKKYK